MLKIYNSLTKKLEPFIPLNPSQIKIYICGPTVYDDSHIGHARTYIAFDTIRSILENYFNYTVTFVMNITDIDDKIINKSKLLNVSMASITEKYTEEFLNDMKSLNVKFPTVLTKVTDYVEHIKVFIDQLIDNKMAYESDGSIYFDVEMYQKEFEYPIFIKAGSDICNVGDICNNVDGGDKNVKTFNTGNSTMDNIGNVGDENTSTTNKNSINNISTTTTTTNNTTTTNTELNKKNIKDFALWKKSETGYHYRNGIGRPGWHIECSVMSNDIIGQDIDIHAGGIDLKFPHHENEIAQCQAFYKSKWCNYFMHTGHLNINGLKMSKSLKNFTTIKSILTRCTPIQLRILFLYHHWNTDMNYEEEQIKFAENVEKKIFNFIECYDLKGGVNVSEGRVNVSEGVNKDGNINENKNKSVNEDINTEDTKNINTKISDMNIKSGKSSNKGTSSTIESSNKDIITPTSTKPTSTFNKLTTFKDTDDKQVLDKLTSTLSSIHTSYCNNFDTPSVMKSILDLISFTRSKNIKQYTLIQVQESIKKHLSILRLTKERQSNLNGIPELLNDFRNDIRIGLKKNLSKSEMFQICDRVREDVQQYGYIIEDGKNKSSIKEM